MDDVLADFLADIAQTEQVDQPEAPESPSEPEVDELTPEPESASPQSVVQAIDGILSPDALRMQIEQLKQQSRESRDPEGTQAPVAPQGPPTVTPPPAPSASSSSSRAPPPFNNFSNVNVGLSYGMRPPIMTGPPQLSVGTPSFSSPPVLSAHGPPTVLPPVSSSTTVTIGGLPVHNPIITTSATLPRKHRHNAKSDASFYRQGAGKVWEDETLKDWPDDDFRIFVGNLGNDVNVDTLSKAFSKYPSFQKAKVIRDKKTNKTKGFGFVSFADSRDMIRALKEMNNKYVGNRPVMLRASKWKDRSCETVVAKDVLKDQKATGWEQKKKRRYHVNLEVKTA